MTPNCVPMLNRTSLSLETRLLVLNCMGKEGGKDVGALFSAKLAFEDIIVYIVEYKLGVGNSDVIIRRLTPIDGNSFNCLCNLASKLGSSSC
jgi:hypothetical protein